MTHSNPPIVIPWLYNFCSINNFKLQQVCTSQLQLPIINIFGIYLEYDIVMIDNKRFRMYICNII